MALSKGDGKLTGSCMSVDDPNPGRVLVIMMGKQTQNGIEIFGGQVCVIVFIFNLKKEHFQNPFWETLCEEVNRGYPCFHSCIHAYVVPLLLFILGQH